jgi:5-formyltetrahydrofolate cyclo-ligase
VQKGKRVLLPFLEGETMAAAEFVPGPEGAMVQTTYGPKEPASRVPVHPGEVDVVILPGLAFDRAGYRLGYGGGYYDRYLTGLRPDAVRIGIGFAVQLVDAVPHGEGDARLDVTVTDRETVRHPARR